MRKRVVSSRGLRTHGRETKKTEQSSGSKKNKSISSDTSALLSPSTSSKKITSNRKAAKSSIDLVTSRKSAKAEENKPKKRRRDGKSVDCELPKGQFDEDKKSKDTLPEIQGAGKKRVKKTITAAAATPKVHKITHKKSEPKESPVKVTKKKGANKKENFTTVDEELSEVAPEPVDKRRSLRTKPSSAKTETITKTKNIKKCIDRNLNKCINSGPSQPITGKVVDTQKELFDKHENATVSDSRVDDESLEVPAKELKSNKLPVQVSKSKKKCDNKHKDTAALNLKLDQVASAVSGRRHSLRTKIQQNNQPTSTEAESVRKVIRRNKGVDPKTVQTVASVSTGPEIGRVLDEEKQVDANSSQVPSDTSQNKLDPKESPAVVNLGAITMRRPHRKVESEALEVQSKILPDTTLVDSDRSALPLDATVPVYTPGTSELIGSAKQTERSSKVPSLPRKLRHRVLQDYAESSLEGSKTEDTKPEEAQQNNVPIYKRKLDENPVNKNKKGEADMYEFDSDIEDGARKKKKRKLDDPYYDEYNKTISNIMQNVMKKVKNKRAKKDGNGEDRKLDLKQKILKPDAESRKPEAKLKAPKRKAESSKPKTQNKRNHSRAISKDIMNKVTVKLVPLNLDRIKDNVQVLRAEKKLDLNENKETLADDSDGDHTDQNFDNFVSDNYDGEDFDEFLPPITRSDRVHVVSDILLNASKSRNSPWRFSQRNVTRNPHFITLKPSALPAVNQEMVLDHTMVDKFDELSKSRCEKTPPDSTIPKRSTVVQTTVTDFFKSSSAQLKENPRLSLFDCEDFSPIKHHVSNASLSVETRNSVKRKILTENVNPNQMASTPIREAGVRNPEAIDITAVSKPAEKDTGGIESCFGFDSDDEQDEPVTPKTAIKNARPFRLSEKVVMKRYERKEKPKTVPEVPEQIVEKLPEETTEKASDDVGSESDSEESEVQSTIPEVGGIFQDLSNAEKELKPKEPKQKKLKWLVDDDDEILKFKKKRKDVRTKEEEEAAEKWAADFNSMCEEIDQFPLEIE